MSLNPANQNLFVAKHQKSSELSLFFLMWYFDGVFSLLLSRRTDGGQDDSPTDTKKGNSHRHRDTDDATMMDNDDDAFEVCVCLFCFVCLFVVTRLHYNPT